MVDESIGIQLGHDGWPNDESLLEQFSALGLVAGPGAMLTVLRHAWKAAQVSDAALLIEGETGTGKQVLAQAVHRLDQKRSRHRFVTVHCGTVQENLAECELFGHQRGAFSGAVGERKGLFQSAHLGTLLLDDVNDLSLSLQPKLLDVLQRGVVRAVGSDQEVPIDVRVIAACNQPLELLVHQSLFRSDLFYRLDVIHLTMPALYQRLDDLPRLLLAMARRYSDIYNNIESVDSELVSHLESRPFPGNVRELEHAVQRMLFHKTAGTSLTLADWVAQDRRRDAQLSVDHHATDGATLWNRIVHGDSYNQILNDIEKEILEAALSAGGRTRREIAKLLHISERKLYNKIRAHRLSGSASAADSCTETAESGDAVKSMSQIA